MSGLLLTLLDPKVLGPLIALLGTLAGFFIKKWITAHDAKTQAETQSQQEDQTTNAEASQIAADTGRVNAQVQKENTSAGAWLNKP